MSKHAELLRELSVDLLEHYGDDERALEAAAAHIERLEALLAECADDLAERVDQEYPEREQYPDMVRRYERDMDCVYRARTTLSADSGEEG